MKTNGSSGMKILIVILVLLLVASLGSGGYFAYKYFDDKQENNPPTDNNETNNSQETVTVVDAVSFTETKHEASKVTLPRITSTKENAEKLNKQMLAEVLSRRYSIPTEKDESSTNYAPKGIITSYSYVIKNDIIAIGINESGEYIYHGSGSGLNNFTYFYDIKNDKIIDKLSEAAKLMELTDIDGAPDYESLDKNICTKSRVEDNKIIINYASPEDACV